MEREKIDFTDKELYYVALAFESHLNSRDTWISKGGAKVINNAIKKITENGLKGKTLNLFYTQYINLKTKSSITYN